MHWNVTHPTSMIFFFLEISKPSIVRDCKKEHYYRQLFSGNYSLKIVFQSYVVVVVASVVSVVFVVVVGHDDDDDEDDDDDDDDDDEDDDDDDDDNDDDDDDDDDDDWAYVSNGVCLFPAGCVVLSPCLLLFSYTRNVYG